MKSIQLGLIGCGQLGRIHAQCISRIKGARFIAYADQSKTAADVLLQEFSGIYSTVDAQRVLEDDDVDAVYICTQHDSHALLAIAAARAGKHVFIEKPLALDLEDCEAISRAVEEAGVYLMPAFKMRYYPLIRQARAFISQPQVLVGQMMDDRWPDDIWAQDPVRGGGNVHSQGCHMTDLLRYLAGSEPTRIAAMGGAITHPGHACLDQCVASVQFANGHVASWIQGDAGTSPFASKFFIQMFGDGKSVQIYDRFKRATFRDGDRTWVEDRNDEEGFQLENQAFVDALRRGEQSELTPFDGVQATRMVLLADEAIRSGQVQTLTCESEVAASVL